MKSPLQALKRDLEKGTADRVKIWLEPQKARGDIVNLTLGPMTTTQTWVLADQNGTIAQGPSTPTIQHHAQMMNDPGDRVSTGRITSDLYSRPGRIIPVDGRPPETTMRFSAPANPDAFPQMQAMPEDLAPTYTPRALHNRQTVYDWLPIVLPSVILAIFFFLRGCK